MGECFESINLSPETAVGKTTILSLSLDIAISLDGANLCELRLGSLCKVISVMSWNILSITVMGRQYARGRYYHALYPIPSN